ncbi:MAG: hypothetical protein AB8B61_05530 [Cyclobacteriaceae bacterium]
MREKEIIILRVIHTRTNPKEI